MTLLDVAPAGLETLAGHCGTWAGEVAGAAGPGVPTAAGHASAVAVAAIHARVGVSAEGLAARMIGTTGKLTAAAATYTSQDDQSAGRIAGVARLI